MYKYSKSQYKIIEEIKVKKGLMIKSANTLGYTSNETVKYSQELDELINEYQREMRQTSKSNDEVKIIFKQMIMIWPKALV
ncbi:MAG: aspartyl-phosphate phosphatase Spo0E family protein [Bacillus sp. (in: Bacteria)]|nr:aspartyl-phosphate phosphatase Spo0E family protein [Bacillus sp. (in: firmicutes)]